MLTLKEHMTMEVQVDGVNYLKYFLIQTTAHLHTISFGEGFIRVSMQSEESVEELFEMFKERNLKLVIVN
jgi:hypothetical protein